MIAAKPIPYGTKPNIIIFYVDDLGYGDLRLTGHPSAKTPNIMRLAAEGLTLSNWYAAAPLCTPSRAGLLTGRLPVRTGMTNEYGGVAPCDAEFGLPLNETTIAEHLKKVGYSTSILGKWHLGQRPEYLPTNRGFDSYLGVPYSVDMGCPRGAKCPNSNCPNLPLLENLNVLQQPVNLTILAERYATQATNFVQQNQNNPFFLYMAFNHVHATVPGVDQYAGPNFAGKSLRGPFGDAVEEMDWILGEIMNKVRSLGLINNTIVFFTSDNGPWLEKGPIAGGSEGIFTGTYAHMHFNYTDTGKASTWEGGVRVPAVVWWPPYFDAGALNQETLSSFDIFPTCLKLAGVPIPTDRIFDGYDILPTLINGDKSPHEFYFIYRGATLFAARNGPWKIHLKTKSGFGKDPIIDHNPPLLFNVDDDPSETYALPVDQHQQIVQNILNAIQEHNKHVVPGKDQVKDHNKKYEICCNLSNGCVCG